PTGQPPELTAPSSEGIPSDLSSPRRIRTTGLPLSHKPLLALSKKTHETITQSMKDGTSSTTSIGIKEQVVRLLDPITPKEPAETESISQACPEEIGGPLLFSPDGAFLVKGDSDGPIWAIDLRSRSNETLCNEGEPITFVSSKELALNVDGRIKRLDLTTQKSSFATPTGMTYLSVSADGHIALLRPAHSNQ